MVDLSAEMADLWRALGASAPGRARIVQFVAARRGEGTSTVAREFARYAAGRQRRTVWLVDLDLAASPQYATFAEDPERYGPLADPVAASPDGSMFFTVQPPIRAADGSTWPDAGFLVGHQAGETRLWITRFRREALHPGQSVHVLPNPGYWSALAKFCDLIVVDCPSTDRSKAALTLAPLMDQTVLVVAAEQANVSAPQSLRDALGEAGGRVAGLFLNRTTVEPPGFLKVLRL